MSAEAGIATSSRPAEPSRWRGRVVRLLPRLLVHAVVIGVVLGGLELAVSKDVISDLVLPRPSEVLQYLRDDVVNIAQGGYIAHHYVGTLLEIIFGFFAALVGGVALGAVISEWPWARRILYPYVIAMYSTPRIAIAPLVLIWFGFGMSGKVFLGASIAIFPILVSTVAGLQATDPKTLRLLHTMGATRAQTFWKVRTPMALSYIFPGLESASVLAAVGAVVGEFTGGNRGLGYLILVSQQQLALAQVFALLVILSINGYALFVLVAWARKRIVYWGSSEQKILDR